MSLRKLRLTFEDCQKALELNPSNEGAYYNLAHIFARSGQPEMAEKCREKYKELTGAE
jgi:Tfp pilus assembly protein PilF